MKKSSATARSLNWLVALFLLAAFAAISISFFKESTKVIVFTDSGVRMMRDDLARSSPPLDIQQFTRP